MTKSNKRIHLQSMITTIGVVAALIGICWLLRVTECEECDISFDEINTIYTVQPDSWHGRDILFLCPACAVQYPASTIITTKEN